MNRIELKINDDKSMEVVTPQPLVEGENRTTEIALIGFPAAWAGSAIRALITTPKGVLVDAVDASVPVGLTNTMLDGKGTLYVEYVAMKDGTEIARTKSPALLPVSAARSILGDIDPAPLPDLVAEMVAAKGGCDSAAAAAVLATERIETTDADIKAAEAIRQIEHAKWVGASASAATLEPGAAVTASVIDGAHGKEFAFGIPGNIPIDDASAAPDKVLSAQYVKGKLDQIAANLFNPATVTPGYYINNDGAVNAYGSNIGGHSDYISVIPGKTYVFINGAPGAPATKSGGWYFANKTFKVGITYAAPAPYIAIVTAPADAYFVRINYTTANLAAVMFLPGFVLPNFSAFGEKINYFSDSKSVEQISYCSRFYGKKGVFLGDSITAGNGITNDSDKYYALVRGYLGLGSAVNNGISGTLITHEDARSSAFVDRYSALAADADLICVYGGINDYFVGTGVFGSADSVTTTEFYGAINVLIQGLITKYPSKTIVFIVPFNSFYVHSSDTVNASSGQNLKGYVDAIKTRCAYYGIPVLDLFEKSGIDAAHNTESRTQWTQDGLHPNVAGNKLIAQKISAFVATL